MNTYDVGKVLKLAAQLMELHNENPFKTKALATAAYRLSKMDFELDPETLLKLEKTEGFGKSTISKIEEVIKTGTLAELNAMIDKTPSGVIDMLGVKGIGPKKVSQLWNELGIESVGELLYACNENRLILLKGFGAKTQDQVKKFIEFYLSNKGKFLYAAVEEFAEKLVGEIKKKTGSELVSLTGAMRRKCEIIEKIEIVAATDKSVDISQYENLYGLPLEIISCKPDEFYQKLFETTGTEKYSSLINGTIKSNSEEEIFNSLGMQYIEPELREGNNEIDLAKKHLIPKLVEYKDLKGILHNHTTYSDGVHTLREMAEFCKNEGFEYLGICDHSQSAFYAEGLKPERVLKQQEEIDQLNRELFPFRIFKGIESDILYDGNLDYTEDILKTFDFIVASIHSTLKMDEVKATSRLIKAIENPYTSILGHATGRLLLARQGYPIDHKKIIDACAANNVVIELNANPYRLDIDWRWIPYCLEKGVMISINPDAHSKEGFNDMHYGVYAARKGGLFKEMCFNALPLIEVERYFKNQSQVKNLKPINS
jgi:DNA polymerase (family X)